MELIILKYRGRFDGMSVKKCFQITMSGSLRSIGLPIEKLSNRTITYIGQEQTHQFK